MFEALVGYLGAEVGVATALIVYAQRSPEALLRNYPVSFEGKPHVSNVEVRFVVRSLMIDLADGRWPASIDMALIPLGDEPLTAEHPWSVPAIKPISAQNIRSAFLYFYETNKDSFVATFGSDRSAWPMVLRFATVIRNACSHDGKISITNPNAPAATWNGLSYSAADNGKEILFGELATADLIVLMHEVSALL